MFRILRELILKFSVQIS